MTASRLDVAGIFRGSLGVLAVRAGSVGFLWVADLVLARSFGPAITGDFYVWWTLVSIFAIISVLGIGELIVREIANAERLRTEGDARSIYRHALRLVFGVSCLFALGLGAAALLLEADRGRR